MKPRVLIYALGLADIEGGKFAGNFYHVFRLVAALAKENSIDLHLLVDPATADKFSTVISKNRIIVNKNSWWPKIIGNDLVAMFWSFKLSPDIFHRPAGQLPVFPFNGVGIMGVADINFRDMQWGGLKRLYKEVTYQLSIVKSARIIAISEFTARRVKEAFYFTNSKLICIHHGAETEEAICPKPPQGMSETDCFWLCLGHRANKNLELAVAAFSKIKREALHCRLVVVGDNFYSRNVVKASEVATEIDILPYLSESEIAWLYSHACGLLFPSLYEGFGLPILEAMRRECPVLASDIEVHREVAGVDGAVLLPLDDVAKWVAAMCQLMSSPSYRKARVAAGKSRVMEFTWALAAKKTRNVYLNLAKKLGRIV